MELDYSWSRLIHTPIGRLAEIQYTSDKRRTYHNWVHILRGYEHAQHTLNLPYCVNLDLAWLLHDWIYDEFPDKELRSITAGHEALERVDPIEGVDMDVVDALVESSINHSLVPDTRLIKLDLADLTIPSQTKENHGLILTESQALYNISKEQFAEQSVMFMTGMRQTMLSNSKNDPDGLFWSLVLRGVDQTISLSEDILNI